MTSKKITSLIFLNLVHLSLPTIAATYHNEHWFLGAGVGANNTHLNHIATVPNGSFAPSPYDVDTFTIKNPSTQVITQLTGGYRWNKVNPYLPYASLFFQYRHYDGKNITGTVQQYSLPGFTNYSYKMKYRADLLTLTGKFNLIECKAFSPFVTVGTGVVLNSLNTYNETAFANVTPRINPAYQGNQHSNWAGTLGAGVDWLFKKELWLTLGYEHVFQGSLKSTGTGSWSGTTLDFGTVKMDTVFLSLSTIIPQT